MSSLSKIGGSTERENDVVLNGFYTNCLGNSLFGKADRNPETCIAFK